MYLYENLFSLQSEFREKFSSTQAELLHVLVGKQTAVCLLEEHVLVEDGA